jgi:pimeloyl-ACP methyl ester carboxylesterase
MVILVPGGTTGAALVASHDYAPMAKALNAAGYNFIVANMRASYNYPYAEFDDAVKDIAGFVDYAKATGCSQMAIVGVSLGGPRMAQYMAERGDPSIRAVAFVASIPSPYLEFQVRGSDTDRQRLEDTLEHARELIAQGRGQEPLAFENWFPDGRSFMVTAQAMLGFFGAPEDNSPSSIRYGQQIKVPALVLHGDRDELSLPPNAQTIYDSLSASPQRDLIWVEGASHYLTPGGIAESYARHLADWIIRNMPV